MARKMLRPLVVPPTTLRARLAVLLSFILALIVRADDAVLHLRIAVIGERDARRASSTKEAVAFWNEQLEEAGARIRLGPVESSDLSIPEQTLAALSDDVRRQRSLWRVAELIEPFPEDVVMAMSRGEIMSFAVPWRRGSKALVAIRRADIEPLSLPNVARNAIAHELGHVLGLPHNSDPESLMCGRPAPCRPEMFESATPRFFPLTASEKQRLRELWSERGGAGGAN